MRLFFLISYIITSLCTYSQSNAQIPSNISDIKLKYSKDNVIKVYQGGVVYEFNLNRDVDEKKFLLYLKSIPQIAKNLENIEDLLIKIRELLNNSINKPNDQREIFLSNIVEEIRKLERENNILKSQLENLRKQTDDSELSNILIEANKALDRFENEKYQIIIEEYKLKEMRLYQKKGRDIAKLSYLQAINFNNRYLFNMALKYIDEAIKYDSINTDYLSFKGRIYNSLGDDVKALKTFLKASAIYEGNLGKEHILTASFYNLVGLGYLGLGNNDSARIYFNRVIEVYKKNYPKENPMFAVTYISIGLTYEQEKNYNEALDLYKHSLTIFNENFDKKNLGTGRVLSRMANCYQALKQLDLAIDYNKQVLEIYKEIPGISSLEIALIYNNLGTLYSEKGEYKIALEYLEKSMAIHSSIYGFNHKTTMTNLENMAIIYIIEGNFSKAKEYLRKTWFSKESDLDRGKSIYNMGVISFNEKSFSSAAKYYEFALEILNNNTSPELGELYVFLYYNLAHAYCKQGDKRALEFYNKAKNTARKNHLRHKWIVKGFEQCKKDLR